MTPTPTIKRKAVRAAGNLLAFAGVLLVVANCGDLATDPGNRGIVDIAYIGPPNPGTGDTIKVNIGDKLAPKFQVTLNSTPQPTARYVFSASYKDSVMTVSPQGDTITIRKRGSDTLYATLMGATLGDTIYRAFIVVTATPKTNSIDSATVTLNALNQAHKVRAASFGSDNQPIEATGTSITWTSTNPAVATVTKITNDSARITAISNGTALVIADFDNGSALDTVAVTVQQRLKAYVLTSPGNGTGSIVLHSVTQTIPVTATPVDSNDNVIAPGDPVTPSRPGTVGGVQFGKTNVGAADIHNTTGVVTAQNNGTDSVFVSLNGTRYSSALAVTVQQVAASVTIIGLRTDTIPSKGQERTYTVVVKDSLGQDWKVKAGDPVVNWSSSVSAVASATPVATDALALTAIVKANDVGSTTLRAQANLKADSITVIVTNDPDRVFLLPDTLPIRAQNDTARFDPPVVRNAKGDVLSIAARFRAVDTTLVTVDSVTGLVTAKAAFTNTPVIAFTGAGAGLRADTATVKVTNYPDTVSFGQDSLFLTSLQATQAVPFSFKNRLGAPLGATAVTWTSLNNSIAQVSIDGVVTAVGIGTVPILATSAAAGNPADTIFIKVTNDPASVTVSTVDATTLTQVDQQVAFNATVRNGLSAVISGATVAWSSSNTAVATVDAVTGRAKAVANGSAFIRATSGSAQDSMLVTVGQAISFTTSSISVDSSGGITANGASQTVVSLQLKDASGANYLGASASPNFSATLGTVSAATNAGNGLWTATLTAGTVTGTSTVTATLSGPSFSSFASVAFNPATAAKYLVTTPNTSPVAGANITMSAQLADANNNFVKTAGQVVTWGSTGGGLFSAPTSNTDANGVATVTFTVSATASTIHVVSATTGGLVGSSANITAIPGNAQNYLVTPSSLSPAPVSNITVTAQLRDVNNNNVSLAGQTVTWGSTNGGSFGSPTSVTNSAGQATVSFTTAGTAVTPATHQLSATTGGVTGTSANVTTVSASLANSTISVTSNNPTVATSVTITVQLKDNANANINVSRGTVVISSSGTGTISPTADNGDGTYTATITSPVVGSTVISATIDAGAITSGNQSITFLAGAATQIAVNGGNNQTASSSATLPTPPSVIVKDAQGNPVSGVSVTFTLTGAIQGTTSPTSGSAVLTDANGVATLTSWTLGGTAGTNTMDATVAALALTGEPVTFTATGTVGAASSATSLISSVSSALNSGQNATITVQLKDVNGNNLTISGGGVTLSSNIGTFGVVTDNLNGTYTAMYTATTTGTATISGTVNGATMADTHVITVSAGAAAALTVTTSPSSSPQSGIAFVTQPQIQLRDAAGNAISTAGVDVQAVIQSGGGTLGGTTTVQTNGSGVAVFTNLSISGTIGARTLRFGSPTVAGSTVATVDANVTLVAGTATQLAITSQPSATATAGIQFSQQPVVQIRDAAGNVVITDNSTVVTASRNAGAGTLGGTINATVVNGVATFINLSHPTTSTISIDFTSGGLITATSNNVAVSAGAASTLVINTQPSSTATAGSAFATQPVIHIRDAQGNIVTSDNSTVVNAVRQGGIGALGGTVSATAAAGVVTFTSLQHDVATTITVQFTSGSLTSATSNSIVVSPSAATNLAVITAPSANPQNAFVLPTQPAVQLRDAQGNAVDTDGVNVTAAITSGGGILGGTLTVATVDGVATFTNLSVTGSIGARTITFSSGALTTASSSVTLVAGTLNNFLVEQQGGGPVGTQAAGAAFNLRITARDVSDNTVSAFNGTVTLTSTGTLTGSPVTSGAFSNGVLASQAVTITNTGSFSITATNGSAGSSNTFSVVPGAAVAATTTASVPAGTAGAVTSISIQAKDANGNNRTSTSGAVVVSVTGSNTTTAAVIDNLDGTYTASYTPTVSGSDNIAITLSGSPISGSPFTSAIAIGALDHFNINSIATQAAGAPFAVTITAKDANNNTVTSFVGTVDISSTGTLSGGTFASSAFTAGVLASQNVTINNAGSFTITATRTGFSETGTSNTFTVNVGAANAAASTANVPAGVAGSLTTITVQAKDAIGNNRTVTSGAVVVSVTGANITSASVTDNGNGTYTATYTPTVAGTDNINITLGGVAINSGANPSYTSVVAPGTLHHFAVTTTADLPIGSQTAGSSFNVKVVAQDANNNTVPSFTGTVDLTSTGALTGTTVVTGAFTSGVFASQALTITNTGTFTLTATRSSGGSQSGTSNSFGVVPGAAAAAQSTASVPAGTSGLVTTITIQAKDANSNNRTSSSGAVVVAVTGANTTTASVTDNLNGTYTATYSPTASGTDNIAITLGGSAISGSPFTSAVSPSSLHHFAVTNTSDLAIGGQVAGTGFNIKIVAQDASNNTVPSFTGTVDISSTGTLSAGSGTTAAFTAGVLASHAVTISNTGSFTITATRTSGGAQTGTSNTFAVGSGAASAANSTASVPAGTSGSLTTISIQAKDANNNNLTTGGAAVLVAVSGANTVTSFAATDNGNGTYTASYTPSVSGTDNIAITLGGTPISGSPYSSVVSPGAVASFLVEQFGGGAIPTQTAGASFNIRLTAKDANNNTVTAFNGAGNTVQITSTGTLSAGSGTTATFTAGVLASHAVTITNTGSWTITATRTAGTQTGTSATFSVTPGAASAAQTTATVPAGTGGSVTTITVQARDAFGNSRTATSGTIAASITGANTATGNVVDNADGTYTVTYTPSVGGTDAIAITLGGTPIGGSPYSSVVGAGSLAKFQVDAQGGGAIGSQSAGTSFNIRVIAQDANSNTVPGFTGTVNITSSGTLSAGGGVTASFVNGVLASHAVTISNTGSFTITATSGSTGQSNSFSVGAGATSAALSEASVPAGTAGALTTILIQAKDALGNNRTSTSGTAVVSVSGANTATASITDNLNGTYTATYTPTISGTDNINITLGGVAINGGASPSYTSAVAVGALHHFNINTIAGQTAGSSFSATITAKDANNNTVTGFTGPGSTVDITSTGTLTGAPVTSGDFTAGVRTQTGLTITNTGSFTITATRTGFSETGTSNSFAVAPGASSAANSTGSVPAGIAGSLTSITVQAKDANNNNRTSGGDVVVVTVAGANTASPSVTDNGNGTYSASYTPTVAGTDNITITLGGVGISGSIFSSAVAPATLHHFAVTAAGGSLPIGTQAAGTGFNIRIVAQDANNNTVTGFTGTVALTSTGALTGAPVTTAAFTAGVLASHSATITNTGSFTITATRSSGGVQSGTSNTFLVTSGAATALFLAQQPSAAPTAGVVFAQQPVVYVRDASNNVVTGDNTTVVTASLASGSGALQGTTAVTAVNGVATFTNLSHNVANTITLQFTAGGLTTAGPSNNVVVGHAALDNFLVEAAGGGAIASQTASGAFNVQVTARDAFSNTVTSFTGGGNTAVITTTGTPNAQGTTGNFVSGVFASHAVTITNTGSFTVTATGGGKTGTSNSFTVGVGAVSAAASTATVPAGTAGSVTSITVQTKDAAGNNRTTGGDAVVITITGSNSATPTVTDVGNGTYTASYTPTVSGSDNVAITLGGVAISGSPYTSVVSPGALASFTFGAIGAQTAGSSFNVAITARDANNNIVTGFTGTVVLTSTGTLTGSPLTSGVFVAGVRASQAVTITNTGNFTLTATRSAGTESGTSASFAVAAGAAAAAQSIATVPAGAAGSVTSVTVQSKDANGNNRTTGGATVVAAVSGANTASPSVTDVGNGTYTFSYTPTVSGTDAITITLGGTGISGSPYQSVVGAGAVDHYSVEYEGGGGIPGQTAGIAFNVRVVAHDANHNTVTGYTGAGTAVNLTSTGTLTGTPVATGTFTNGVYAAQAVTITNTGSFTMTATRIAGGAQTGTSNSFAVVVGAVSAAQSTAVFTPPGASTAGQQTSILIQAKDANGNNRTTTSGAVVVSVTGSNTATGVVTDNLDGTYTATYTPTASGTDNVAITLGAVAISGSPFSRTINVGALNNFLVEQFGGGAIGAQVAGTPFNIRVTARDAGGNTVTGFTGTVTISSTGTLSAGSGVTAAFTAGVLASHSVTVSNTGSFTITATNVQTGTSNSFSVTPGASAAATSTASVPSTGTSSSLTSMTIQAKDANGNNRTVGGDAIVVSVSGANTATASVTDNSNGTYTATYTPTVAGTDNIAITLGGTPISGSPFSSVISPATLHHFAVTNTSDLPIAGQAAGVAFNIKVVAQDANNNTVTGFTGTVALTSTGTLTGSPVTTAAFTAGVLASQSVTITNTGTFTITATRSSGGSQSGTSNSFAVAAGAASAAQSTASVPAGTAGVLTTISIQAKDANGNNRTTTSGTVVVSVTGANTATASVTDNGNGTYTATYTPTVSGTDNLAITLGGVAISGSPYSSAVSPAALDHFAFTTVGAQAAGTSFSVTITAQDAFNNTVTGFVSTVQLTSTGTLTGSPVTTGTFTAGVRTQTGLVITNTGSFTLTADDGASHTGTSNSFAVAAGAANAAASTATVPAGTAGSLTTITVQAKDAVGNNRTTTSGTVVVTITGANSATPSVTDNGNGTYTTSYTPTASGSDNVAITLGGVAIGGSPYTSVVSPGALDHFAFGAIASQTAGSAFTVAITAQDANNNTVTGFTGTVVLTSTGTLTGSPLTSGAFTAGVRAAQSVTITNTGSFTLTATRSAGTETGTSGSFSVVTGAASAAQSTASVPAGTAGSVTTITVQAKDVNGNNRTTTSGTAVGSVTGANTGATVNVVDNTNGTYTLTYTPTVAGTDAITITLGGTGISGSPYSSVVGAGTLHHYSVENEGGGGIPGQTAGTSFNVRVVAHDLNHNVVTSFTGAGNTVDISSSGTLSAGNGTTATFVNGVLAAHAVTISNTGSFTITATKTSDTETGTSNSFSVVVGAVSAAQSTAAFTPPGASTAGQQTSILIQAKDANGNNRTTTSGAVVVSVTGSNTTSGVVTDNLDGTYTATYTPTASGTDNVAITLGAVAISGSPFSRTINVGALNNFLVEAAGGGAISAQVAGTPFNIQITARDAGGNTVTGFTGTVNITSTGTLSAGSGATAAFTAGVLASHSVTISNTGSFTITATNVQSGTSNSFSVTPGATAAAQSTASVPSTGTSGSLTTITIQAKDANGNNRTVGGDVVVASVTNANTATASITDNSNGTYTATYTPTVAGTDNIAITIGGTPISGSPFSSTINPASLHHFAVTNTTDLPIGSQAAGTPFNIKVVAQDANNNTVTGFTGNVNLTSTGTLTGSPVNAGPFIAGVLASQAVTITNTGNFTITATRASGGSQSGTSNTFLVNSGAATALFLAQGPSASPTAGVVFAQQPVVYIRDASNNIVTGDNTTVVTATVASGSGTLQGTTSVTAVNGVATFTNLYHTVANAITIDFDGGVLATATSGTVTVGHAPLDHFLVEAAGGGAIGSQIAGTSFNIQATAQDVFNNTVTSFNGGANTAVITTTGTPSAQGTTAAFTNGVFASHAVTITNTGSFTVTATGGGKNGTSNSFSVAVGAVDAASSTATVPNGTAASVTSIVVQAKDANGNNRTTGGSTVVITITGSNSATPTVTDVGNGTYTASYTPTASGSDNVAITLGGVAISGSPYTSTVSAGATASFEVTNTSGGAIPTQIAGGSFNIRVRALDANGNVATSFTGSGNAVTISSTGTLSAGSGTTATFTNGVLASHAVAISNTGSFTITATRAQGGLQTGTSNSFTVDPGSVSAAQSTASVPSGTAGAQTTVTIQAKDANGNNLTTGGASYSVTVSGANSAGPTTATDNTNGTYTFLYTPTASGVDNIAIILGGTPISGSPYSSAVAAGAVDHFSVENEGGGGIPGQIAGTSFNIRVVAHDANHNTATTFTGAGNTVDVTSSGTLSAGSGTSATFVNGVLTSHAVTISNTSSPTFTITATKTSDTETGTSNAFSVIAGAASAAQSTASVPAGTAGALTTITIQAKDANSNNRTSTSGAVVVSVTGANTATATVTDNLNGTYTATYTPTIAGTDNVAITLGGNPISGSPYSSVVNHGALDHFSFGNISNGKVAGTPFTVDITAQDAFNNTVLTFTTTAVLTSTGDLTGEPLTSAAFTLGVLTGQSVTITNAGTFTITATATGQTGNSNSFTVVADAVDAAQSTATVPNGTAGAATSIVVQARDANGVALAVGGETVVVTVTGANSATPVVTDNGNGTYSASYSPTASGSDNVAITLGGSPISGSPFTSVVSPGALDHFAFGAIGTQTAGSSFNVSITAQDANNNTVTGFTGTVVLTSTGSLTGSPLTSGAFTAGVRATQAVTITNTGSFTLTAARSAGTEAGTSASFSVDAGAASAAQSTASVPSGTAGAATTISVQAKDANGNNRASTSGAVVGTVTGANTGATVNVVDNLNGTYTLDYTPTAAGTDAITITLGGSPIGGSPYSSIVGAGALDHFSVENVGGGGIPTQKAGTSFNIRVVAHDVFDNVVPSFSGGSNTVDISSSDGAIFTVGGTTTAAFVNGILASHTVQISNNGDFSITATKTADTENGTSNTFTVLGIPVAVAATAIGDENFTANWNAFTDASSYRLDVSASPVFAGFVPTYQNKVVSGTSDVVTGLSANTTYYYRVRASVGGIITTSSNVITITTHSADGSGNADITPTTVTADIDTTLVMTYTAAAGGMASGGQITMVVPAEWSAPQTGANNVAGFTRVSFNGGGLTTTGVAISGSGPWLVTYTLSSALTVGQTIDIVYGDASGDPDGAALTPQTDEAGNHSFTVQQRSSSTGTLTNVAGTQDVTVDPDGSGTADIAPTTATSNVYTTLVLTYTAPLGGMTANSQITMVVPNGWSAPQTGNATNDGYVQADINGGGYSTTNVTASGGGPYLITIDLPSGLGAGQTVLIRYGDVSGGSSGALAPNDGSPTPYVFQAQQKASSGGTLKNVRGTQTVTVSP